VELLGPELSIHRVHASEVLSAVCAERLRKAEDELLPALEHAGIAPEKRPRALRAIVARRLADVSVGPCWLLRSRRGALMEEVRRSGATAAAVAFVAAWLLQYATWIGAWWVLGAGVLGGRLTGGTVTAWALLLLTMAVFRLGAMAAQGQVGITVGAVLKQQLLRGVLRLEPQALREHGIGQLLGEVMEAERVERLALAGGLAAVASVIELVGSVLVLVTCGAGWLPPVAFCVWVCLTALACGRLVLAHRAWVDARVGLTHELVEKLVGHRTRLAQELPTRRHRDEDDAVARYVARMRTVDRRWELVRVAVPRGWLLLGVAACAAPLLNGAGIDVLAGALGGVLLGWQALTRLAFGVADLAGAAIAWQRILQVAAKAEDRSSPLPAMVGAVRRAPAAERAPLVRAEGLTFSYPQRGPVLSGCTLEIRRGDRILLEGRSGAGKSTLARLLSGMRPPGSGLVLLDGMDHPTVGLDAWRRRIVAAPQFHENHVFTGTFAFNVLMGEQWPPTEAELQRAEAVCRELGLGPLLERMPGGMMQMVGESGWQLSHGERSRVFIARTLIQKPELLILDESFAALDPETFQACMRAVLERAPALLLIAHP
jgi:ATP-binding cassette subfamily B protein